MGDDFQVHDVEFADDLGIIINETLPTLKQFVAEGRAKFIGITGYPIEPLIEVIQRSTGTIDVNNLRMKRHNERY